MKKQEISKEEYKQVIYEIVAMRESLTVIFGIYTTNAFDRLIMARIKLEQSTIRPEKPPSVVTEPATGGKE